MVSEIVGEQTGLSFLPVLDWCPKMNDQTSDHVMHRRETQKR